MSLIQDALKRQQQESNDGRAPQRVAPLSSVPETMAVPPRQEPEPDASSQELEGQASDPVMTMEQGQAGKSWKKIAGIIVIIVLLVWGGGMLATMFFKNSGNIPLLGRFLPAMIQGRTASSQPPVKPQAAATNEQKAVVPAKVASSWISLKAATAPAFADEEEEKAEAAASGTNELEEPQPEVAPLPPPAIWPKLKLSAVFSNVGSGRAGARINNRLILLGDQVEGAVLMEIKSDGVLLKCGTETRFLKMGATLH